MSGPIAGITTQALPNNTSLAKPAAASEDQLRTQQTAAQESQLNNENVSRSVDAPPAQSQDTNTDFQQDNLNQIDFASIANSNEETPRGSFLDVEA